MKKPLHPVTDHAVVRYLERVHGVDIEGLRRRIGRKVDLAVKMGANGAVVGGFVYRIEEGRVVTVAPHRQPELRTRRGQAKGGQGMITPWPFGDLTPMKYGRIIADPAWKYIMRSDKGHEKSPEAHYETMGLDDIKALPVSQLAGPDCYLFLWSTWPHLPQALEVMRAWGFAYVTGGSWHKVTKTGKSAFGTGYVLRSSTEPFLVGKIGAPLIASHSVRNVILAPEEIPDGIEAIRREHSRKPPQMREMTEMLLPRQHAAELFAREPWEGHDVWGNEIGKFGEVE